MYPLVDWQSNRAGNETLVVMLLGTIENTVYKEGSIIKEGYYYRVTSTDISKIAIYVPLKSSCACTASENNAMNKPLVNSNRITK